MKRVNLVLFAAVVLLAGYAAGGGLVMLATVWVVLTLSLTPGRPAPQPQLRDEPPSSTRMQIGLSGRPG